MNCSKCGCEIDDLAECCPGCMAVLRKGDPVALGEILSRAVWYWPDANILALARLCGIKASAKNMELEHTRKAITSRLQELKDKELI